MNSYSILLVEDELAMRLGMQHTLAKAGYHVVCAANAEEAIPLLEETTFDLLITDLRMPGMSGMDLLQYLREFASETGVILITAFPEVELAVQAIKAGAFDFLSKPFQNDELLIAVSRFCKFLALKRENSKLRSEKGTTFIGNSPAMLKAFDRIKALADTCVPVLILGPSGSGKELVAAALHSQSKRLDKPFIKINCAALPEQLLESELFGHKKGAFTGAQNNRKGKFDIANGGTLFFDELGEMPLSIQAKLLRVLEDQEITPIGENIPHKVQVRMVFATAKNLEEAIKKGEFREDLYYRINIVPVTLPPLNERGEDVELLVAYFLKKFCAQHERHLHLSDEARMVLYSYPYPGNVRELRNIVERAVILATGDTIRVAELPARMHPYAEGKKRAELSRSLERGIAQNFDDSIAEHERVCILQALEQTGGRKLLAAERLGMTRKRLWLKMRQLGIDL